MKTTIRLHRPGRVPHRGESDRVPVPAGWYELAHREGRVFCPRQVGGLDGGYVSATSGLAVLFVRVVLAVRNEDL